MKTTNSIEGSQRPSPRAVILGAGTDYWIRLGELLEEEGGWSIVYWSVSDRLVREFSERWPKAIVNGEIDEVLMQAESHRTMPRSVQLDEPLLCQLARAQSIALSMMDRMDATGRDFPTARRIQHFKKLAEYWGSIFESLSPDIALFDMSPHVVYDFVAYEMAKVRGIKTLMLERAGLRGHIFAIEQFEGGSHELRETFEELRQRSDWRLSETARQYWQSTWSSDGTSAPPLYKAKMARLGLTASRAVISPYPAPGRVLLREVRQLAHAFRQYRRGELNSYLVSPNSDAELRSVSFLEFALGRIKGLRKRAQLRTYCEPMFSKAMPKHGSGHYVLLALHYQPERSTLPLGGVFGDQLLIAKLLSRHLPEGWTLLVKEHPWQLHPYSKGHLQRDEAFYSDLNALSNVQLMAPDIDTKQLLDESSCVATISGSIGWQALTRNKPILLFGAAWYRFCRGVFEIKSTDDLAQAFSEILTGCHVPPEETQAYLAAVEKIATRAVIEPKAEGSPYLDIDENAKALAACILRRPKASDATSSDGIHSSRETWEHSDEDAGSSSRQVS